jgi:hypothetical protein
MTTVVLVAAGIALVFLGIDLNTGSGGMASSPAPTVTHDPYARPKLNSPTTLTVSASHTQFHLDKDRDYVIKLPTNHEKLDAGVSLIGGRNVVIDGGIITVPDRASDQPANENNRRGLYLDNQTGVTWVHDVRIDGELSEGIDINDQNVTSKVILLAIRAGRVSGYSSAHHPDLLQLFAGPHALYVDGFSGSTDYQGFFLLPEQHYPGHPPRLISLNNVSIDDSKGAYALWRSVGDTWPLDLSNVCVVPPKTSRDLWLWPKPSSGDSSWQEVKAAATCAGV